MQTIWKFPLKMIDDQTIDMPEDAVILCVKLHPISGEPCVWAGVDTDAAIVKHRFVILGTGHPVPDDVSSGNHVDTIMDGAYVWHFFDLGEI